MHLSSIRDFILLQARGLSTDSLLIPPKPVAPLATCTLVLFGNIGLRRGSGDTPCQFVIIPVKGLKHEGLTRQRGERGENKERLKKMLKKIRN